MSQRGRSRLASWAGVLGVVALGASAVLLWQRPAATTDAYLSDVETVRVAVTGVADASAGAARTPRPAPPAVAPDRVRGPQHDAPAAVDPPAGDGPVQDAPATEPAPVPDAGPTAGSDDEQPDG